MSAGHHSADCDGQGTAGSSVVEVMLAALLLAILAIAGASFLYRARGEILNERHRRVALDLANGRLEQLRAAPYSVIRPPSQDYATHYLSRSGTNWAQSSSNPGESFVMNRRTLRMTTATRYVDLVPGDGSNAYDYVRATVTVVARSNANDAVVLETHISP